MFRISDILGKYDEEPQEPRRDEAPVTPEASAPASPPADNNKPLQQIPDFSDISISSVLSREGSEPEYRQAAELYEEAVEMAKRVYRVETDDGKSFVPDITALVGKVTDVLLSGKKSLLQFCLSDYSKNEDYLFYHAVNVCILCVEVGIGMGFDYPRLVDLGLGALLHDIGITRYLDIVNRPAKLSMEELRKVKEHPSAGLDILNNVARDVGFNVFEVVRQEHERVDGSGYPQGLKESAISDYSQIVGLIDAYEAMIHYRPYRNKRSPLETINILLNNKNAYDSRVIKLLIERIGIFPIGIVVRLNTKEIGVVIKGNVELPLRPQVKILYDGYGKPLKQPKTVNLAESPLLFIEECLECLKR